jgi:hypothetical protein
MVAQIVNLERYASSSCLSWMVWMTDNVTYDLPQLNGVRSAPEPCSERSGTAISERPSATCHSCTVVPRSPIIVSSFFLFFIAFTTTFFFTCPGVCNEKNLEGDALNLWHKTSANELKTFLPSQPSIPHPLPSLFSTFDLWSATISTSCKGVAPVYPSYSVLASFCSY